MGTKSNQLSLAYELDRATLYKGIKERNLKEQETFYRNKNCLSSISINPKHFPVNINRI